MYIVTSKPNLISVYSGVVHIIILLMKVCMKLLNRDYPWFFNRHYRNFTETDLSKIISAEKALKNNQ